MYGDPKLVSTFPSLYQDNTAIKEVKPIKCGRKECLVAMEVKIGVKERKDSNERGGMFCCPIRSALYGGCNRVKERRRFEGIVGMSIGIRQVRG